MEAVKKRISILSALMSFSTAANYFHYNPSEPALDQALIFGPLILFSWFIIYNFHFGRNWARVLVLVGACFSLLNFLAVFASRSLGDFIFTLFDASLGLYLIRFLTLPETKEYYKAPKPGMSLVKKVLAVVLCLAVAAGGGAYGISAFKKRFEKSKVWLEDVNTGQASAVSIEGISSSPVFSRDGNFLLYLNREKLDGSLGTSLMRYSLKDKKTEIVYENKQPMWEPWWAADGTSVVFSQGDKERSLIRYSLVDKSLNPLPFEKDMQDLKFSPDGNWLLFTKKNEKDQIGLYLRPAAGGETKVLAEPGNFLYEPKKQTWSPDSAKVAFIQFLELVIYDVKTGQTAKVSLAGMNNFMDVIFYPPDPDKIWVKARQADSASFAYNIYEVAVSKGSFKVLKTGRKMMEMKYDISPDGQKIAYTRF